MTHLIQAIPMLLMRFAQRASCCLPAERKS